MKLEVGKYYRTRDGRKVGPMRDDYPSNKGKHNWHTKCDEFNHLLWSADGVNYEGLNPNLDLIAELTEEQTGTLAELNAQVGDVVEWECGYGPVQWTISKIVDGLYYEPNDSLCNLSSEPYWRIISRAQPKGPVITETVKRIVSGVYGRISVGDVVKGFVLLGFDADEPLHVLSRAELIAARDVFNQLIEAMEE